jgi:hypothetical protein
MNDLHAPRYSMEELLALIVAQALLLLGQALFRTAARWLSG